MTYTLTDNLDLVQVGESFAEANESTYMVGQVPRGTVADYRGGIRDTTFQLPDFDNALQKGLLMDWEGGDALPDEGQLKSTRVIITPVGRSTRVLTRAANRPVGSRFQDLESNIVPVLLAQMYQGIDKDIVAFLTDASNFGQITFGGTGVLDTFAADQAPMWDILSKAINPLRKYARSSPNLQISMYVSEDVMDVFQSHFSFAGAGAATTAVGLGAGPGVQPFALIASLFKINLRLDEVKIFSNVGDTAEKGLTSVPLVQTTGLCWFGVTDKRMNWDISNPTNQGNISPDGAFQLAMGRRPEVVSFIKGGSEVETFVARTAYNILSPRGAAWGKLFPVSEILT